MFHSNQKNQDTSLEDAIMGLSKPKLSMKKKEEVKKHMLSAIHNGDELGALPLGLSELGDSIRKEGSKTSIPVWAKVMLKERILGYIGETSSLGWKKSIGIRYEGAFQGVLATVVMVVFVFMAVLSPFQRFVTYAKSTYIDKLDGDVVVVRKSERIDAKPMMQLKEGDKIITSGNSSLTINYFDDSLTRLDENTSLKVKNLYTEPLNPVATRVEVELEDGRMWTNVVNLVEESTFSVDTGEMKAVVQNKATFDLVSKDEVSEISVFDNIVEVIPKDVSKSEYEKAKIVVAGYKTEVSDNGVENIVLEKMHKNEREGDNSQWIALNLGEDSTYNDLLIDEVENGIGDGENGDLLASAEDVVNLSNQDAEDLRVKFDNAYIGLIHAEAQLVRGTKIEAAEGLNEFKNQVEEILAELAELEDEDGFYSSTLRGIMNDKIAVQLKDFSSFRPGDRLYRAKETLQEIELLLAESDFHKVEIQLEQAEEILFEMQELLLANEPNLATSLLKRYQKRTDTITLVLSDENVHDLDSGFDEIIRQQADQLKALTALEQSVVYRDHYVFKEKVKGVREESLRKFLVALEQKSDQVPQEVLFDVQDLYDSYVDESIAETDMIEPALEKLMTTNDHRLQFIQPDNVSSELGILEVVSEATPDVNLDLVPSNIEES